MSKINMRLSYKELQIIKHALGHYELRKSITDKEREEESRLKMKFANEVADFQERNNI
ncbi:DNA strand exchange inhibitor protein [Pullulanibacillus sp. KACC 23026]|uniref:DNA strand exchange inhibitor protein n=1 Tax=Pullulanibacillus sp. KACC 23026 TaxID=3028315 RepID=UPI0023B0DC8E|nr:DNA strand exchange inhibitor protein [Pullulanibacillus sp. KACC 23026]WEG14131.1 DNA strand exchange inhibitor protein [Pullulanibacillus sp. KACC 23026]